VIYLDSSVALAHLLAEDRSPPDAIWQQGPETRAILGRLAFVELDPLILARALEPFPTPVRTLDGLHLASIEFLRSRRQVIELCGCWRQRGPCGFRCTTQTREL
jgi:hypothetical protein